MLFCSEKQQINNKHSLFYIMISCIKVDKIHIMESWSFMVSSYYIQPLNLRGYCKTSSYILG